MKDDILHRFTILQRLLFGYAVIMLLVMVMATYVTLKLNQLCELTHEITSVDVTIAKTIHNLQDTLFSQVTFEKKYLLSGDEDFFRQFQKTMESYLIGRSNTESILDGGEKKELFVEAGKLYDRYVEAFQEEVAILGEGEEYSQQEYQAERDLLINGINRKLREIIILSKRDSDEKIALSGRISDRVLRESTVIAVLIVIAGVLISVINTRQITRPIVFLKKKTKEIAEGRFVEISGVTSPPEIKALADDFNVMSGRLKELDQIKMDLISRVSHELRTPLTAIREASSMLLEGTITGIHDKQKELLTITREECERLIEAVNKILDLSRMEAKMMEYRFKIGDLVPVIQKTVLKLAPIAQRKSIDLEINPLPELPLVKMDAERVEQILENLLGNALKYSPEKGKVAVNASLKTNGPSFIQVAVRDNGPGISKDNLENIFEPFRRVDCGGAIPGGTGLGLSISKHVITEHGGEIWAESDSGKGSTFFFTLPVASSS